MVNESTNEMIYDQFPTSVALYGLALNARVTLQPKHMAANKNGTKRTAALSSEKLGLTVQSMYTTGH